MTGAKFEKLVEIVATLRGPNGCPWDREQTFESLKPMMVEETYEALEAIDNQDFAHLSEELGDVLLHIVFQAQMGKETAAFDIDNVIDGICAKLIRRHPHVFAGAVAGTSAEVLKNWEVIKAAEAAAKPSQGEQPKPSMLNGIPGKLPALHEAHQISARVARAGFDWPDIDGVFAKLQEEVGELRDAIASRKQADIEDEVGDLLFVLVNIARTLKLDSESALKRANRKFKARFQYMEGELANSGKTLAELPPDEVESLWQLAKKGNRSAMTIRPLAALSEFEQCVELQREAFGWSDADLMPLRFFVVTGHIGGLVLGAYEGERLIGFLSSIPATRDGISYWHSHMLAVAQNHRNKGVGARLKFAQREFAIQRGIRLIEWTFDPLEARNAHFNFQKLGVIVRRYYPNLYGETSGLQGGLPTDRVVAEWWLDRTRETIRGEVRRIAIHPDIQMLKNLDIHTARTLQQRVAEKFQQNLADNFHAVAFQHKADASEYVFVRGSYGVHPAG